MRRTPFALALLPLLFVVLPARADPLPGTKPLTDDGDLAAKMVGGIDTYLSRETAASVEKRRRYWKPDFSSPEAWLKSTQPNRERLKKALGVVDERTPFTDLEYVGGLNMPSLVAETETMQVFAVRWPVLPGVDAEGLLLEPKGKVRRCFVCLPDADWLPEMLVGLTPGPDRERFAGMPEDLWKVFAKDYWLQAQFGRLLAERGGCRVSIPTLIDRKDTWSGNPAVGRMTNQPHREFLYRMSFEMGRHPLGYEVQKTLAAVDWFAREKGHPPIGVYGYGEGGLVAFYAGALDERIRWVAVGGAFGPREDMWREPIYRNVWGLLREFGDADVAAGLVIPHIQKDDRERIKDLLIENTVPPIVDGPPAPREGRRGAAPGRLVQRRLSEGRAEFDRIEKLVALLDHATGPFYTQIGPNDRAILLTDSMLQEHFVGLGKAELQGPAPVDRRKNFDPAARQKRQFDQLVAFNQKLMRDAEAVRRRDFWAKLDTSTPEKYAASCEPLRKQLREEVIGSLPPSTIPLNPRSRLLYDEPKWTGHEVVLDVHPDVFAYGILLLPKDLKPGEKRPVVVCQHGLEGRPQDVCNPKMRTRAYNSFGAQLADLGYIVYAPQNPYIGQDKFRLLQRKANPLGLSLFSFIVAQHERTLDWLATLPNVDADRIAFYGLSYGGKTAMRVPALVPRYCLSICSGDFNEWIRKNVDVDFAGSYMFSQEWEMVEFNLGHTFGYAEMAALIAPRPFMVERGHDDGVGIDEWVAYEYAKVRRHYSRLKLEERTEIEWFAGGHEIHGQGTFRFLKKHLGWPR